MLIFPAILTRTQRSTLFGKLSAATADVAATIQEWQYDARSDRTVITLGADCLNWVYEHVQVARRLFVEALGEHTPAITEGDIDRTVQQIRATGARYTQWGLDHFDDFVGLVEASEERISYQRRCIESTASAVTEGWVAAFLDWAREQPRAPAMPPPVASRPAPRAPEPEPDAELVEPRQRRPGETDERVAGYRDAFIAVYNTLLPLVLSRNRKAIQQFEEEFGPKAIRDYYLSRGIDLSTTTIHASRNYRNFIYRPLHGEPPEGLSESDADEAALREAEWEARNA